MVIRAGAIAVSRKFHGRQGRPRWLHARFTIHQGQWPGFTGVLRSTRGDGQVSRPFHEAPTARSALPTTGSRSPAPAQPPTSRPAHPHCLAKQFRMQFPADTDRPHARNRMISTFWFQNLKYWWGNCMRLFRCCTRYRALHPISGHYTRSERVHCSLIGCTPSSTTSSSANTLRRRNGRHD